MSSVLPIDRSSTRVSTQKHANIIHADRTSDHSAEDSAVLELNFLPYSRAAGGVSDL